MKRFFKKASTLLIAMSLAITAMPFVASAYNIGDVINYAQPTNIVASINGYQLMSYNVDGYTYVVAEDLRHYGLNVIYDNSTRSLKIDYMYGTTHIDPTASNPDYWKIGTNKTQKNILYTDIVTYVADRYVQSFNIDGATIIRFDELASFGNVAYNNDIREISLHMEHINFNPVATFVDQQREAFESIMEESMTNSMSQGYNRNVTCNCILRAKGNALVFEITFTNLTLSASQIAVEKQGMDNNASAIVSAYSALRQVCPEMTAIIINAYDSAGQTIVEQQYNLY